jgi:hypothetical protein
VGSALSVYFNRSNSHGSGRLLLSPTGPTLDQSLTSHLPESRLLLRWLRWQTQESSSTKHYDLGFLFSKLCRVPEASPTSLWRTSFLLLISDNYISKLLVTSDQGIVYILGLQPGTYCKLEEKSPKFSAPQNTFAYQMCDVRNFYYRVKMKMRFFDLARQVYQKHKGGRRGNLQPLLDNQH